MGNFCENSIASAKSIQTSLIQSNIFLPETLKELWVQYATTCLELVRLHCREWQSGVNTEISAFYPNKENISLLLYLFAWRIVGQFGLVLVFCGRFVGCGLWRVGRC